LHPSNLAKRGTVLLFLAFYLYGLGHFPLLGPDEPRYAQVAREMFLRHDWITPTLGGHLWFEKPALLYWMMIGSFKVFGVNEYAARLPAAISGLLTVGAVLVIARGVTRGVEARDSFMFWSVLAAGTMLGIIVFSRAASFDIVLTMTTTWSLAFFLLHEFESELRLRRVFLAGCYACVGASLLAKGLVGIVLPAGIVGLYFLLERRLPRRGTLVSPVWGLPLALIVASVWYLPVIRLHGWLFINQFFIQHHFARYLSNKYHHHAAFYYYLLILPLLALPWTAFLIDGLMQARQWFRPGAADSADDRVRRLMIFALAWILFPLIFFSLSSSKLPGYLLPVLPAAALIIGERFWRLSANSTDPSASISRWPLTTTAVASLVLAVGALIYSRQTARLPLSYAVPIALLLFIAGCVPLLLRRNSVSLICFAATTLLVLILGLGLAPQFTERQSARRLLQAADARGYSNAPLYGLQRDDRSPEFYAAGRIVYEADGEPVMYEGLGQIVSESRRRQTAILTMVPLKDVMQFRELSSMRIDVVGDNGRFALLAVSPP
jgi:4-amino-4-deoxy-L-arabinose transferase-like glycosyltransferase